MLPVIKKRSEDFAEIYTLIADHRVHDLRKIFLLNPEVLYVRKFLTMNFTFKAVNEGLRIFLNFFTGLLRAPLLISRVLFTHAQQGQIFRLVSVLEPTLVNL